MILYILVCVLLAVVFVGAYYAYRIAFYSTPKQRGHTISLTGENYDIYRETMRTLYRNLADKPCEQVSIRTPDGLILSGYYYHTADDAPLDIAFHGYRSGPFTDFCGGSALSFRLGHNLLLVDQRAHGASGGRTITFGIKERNDLLCWVDYALTRFGSDVKICLYGVSMGGTTVLMASELPLPANVKAIVADCPYSSPRDIILSVAKQRGFPQKLVWPLIILGARVYGGFDIREVTAREAVKHARVPILILHGEADSFVPEEMSKAVQDANPERVRRYTFPEADHGISYLVDTPRYEAVVTEFLKEAL